MGIREAIARLAERQDLATDESEAAMLEIMEGSATPAQIGAFAAALRVKGEAAEEIAGLARAMRRAARAVPLSGRAVDVVGTGGDGAHTFNISTLAALVVAAAGMPVAKHGNRAITSACGSADLLEALGVAIDLLPSEVARCIEEVGIGFMFAPIYHPALRHAAAPRKEIGIRTVFNILGPLTNPAGVAYQVVGVAVPDLAGKMAEVLRLLGCRRAMVVHGHGGLDELSLSGPSTVHELKAGEVTCYEVTPQEAGLLPAPVEALAGGNTARNVQVALSVLGGEGGPAREAVLLNAGAALVTSDMAGNLRQGVERAAEAVDSRRAITKLREFARVSTAMRSAREPGGSG